MKPKRIILVRHGQSTGNVDKSHYAHKPDYRIELTEEGMAQASQAGKTISELVGDESVYAYYSPWVRTKQTFEGIQGQMPDKIVRALEDPRLREQDWGHYKETEFLEKENAARKEYGKFYFRLEDGESGADVYDRVSTFLETLHRDFEKPGYPPNALIVTHGVTLLVFCMRWFHWSVEEFEQYRNPQNGQVVVLEQQASGRYAITTGLKRHITNDHTQATSSVKKERISDSPKETFEARFSPTGSQLRELAKGCANYLATATEKELGEFVGSEASANGPQKAFESTGQLTGSVTKYDRPTEPVGEEEWPDQTENDPNRTREDDELIEYLLCTDKEEITLTDDQYQRLLKIIESDPSPNPRLHALMKRKAPWE